MKATLAALLAVLPLLAAAGSRNATAGRSDESVFVNGLKPGQHESLLYVWTSDPDAKDPDFLSVIDANPASPTYGKVIATAPTTGSTGNEAHHFGYTADADRIFAGGLFTNRLFIYDVKTDPRKPKLITTVADLAATTGYSGPHTFYAVPGGVMIAMLGGKDGGAPGGLVTLDNDGKFVKALAAPEYMYDVGVKRELNLMISSSWAHPHSIIHGMAPMSEVGDEVVAWDFATGKVLQEAHLDKAPLEIRWLHAGTARGGFVNCAFGNSVWHWEVKDGKLDFAKVLQLPDGSIPADMRISYDDKFLFVSLFGAGAVNQYDISNPVKPTLVSTVAVPQAQMMKLTPDNQRLYISNSLLSNLDGKVPYRVRLINVGPKGMALDPKFDVDFENLPTGQARPHDMLLK
ncbi:MAG TPA: selenium-binding protein SBP56-related protein [Gemmatimonadales bacterium]|nr:selenium-binding protein SBP56-related protein [Gemmatimonadales bacterium]